MPAQLQNWLTVAMVLTLLLPLMASIWLRFVANHCETYQQRTKWMTNAHWVSLAMIFEIPSWWSLSVLAKQPTRNLAFLGAIPMWVLLLFPLPIAMFIARLISYRSNARVFGRRWNARDICKLAFWRTTSTTVSLLLIAVGIEGLCNRNIIDFTWIFAAGIAALIGKLRLQGAEGLVPRQVKSGELYKRSQVMSKKMAVPIKRVCVVPFGRGRLTNAYGGRNQIAITDDYGNWLHGSQLDYVIGHELAHVKQKDPVKTVITMTTVFAVISAAALLIPQLPVTEKILFSFGVILIPLLFFYALSRRHEYAADRLAVEATREPEMAIRALTALYRRGELPSERSRFLELFSTHPSLWHRIDAIAHLGGLSPENMSQTRANFTEAASGGNS